MFTNHFSRCGTRSSWLSTTFIAALISLTPVCYVVVTNSTTGWFPFHVMLRADWITAPTQSNRVPFPCGSKMPQHRSIALSFKAAKLRCASRTSIMPL